MENTSNVFFESNEPIWFIATDGSKWIGPLSPTDIMKKIDSGELTWAHYAWRKEQKQWERLCDLAFFKAAVPHQPNKIIELEVKEALKKSEAPTGKTAKAPPPPQKKSWYLYYNDTQFGPFSSDEIHRFLRIGKIHGHVHAWAQGMGDWSQLKDVAEFDDSVAEAKKIRASSGSPKAGGQKASAQSAASESAERRADRRKAPRVPLVARALMASGDILFVGVCRDVSIGGMQILTDAPPSKVGTKIRVNVSPANDSKGHSIEAFVAEGQVVRVMEDQRGFSFRFEKLSDSARKAIEKYVTSL